MIPRILLIFSLLCLATVPAAAQRATLSPIPEARKYLVPAAQLMRVDEGVFEMPVESTMDMTDRKVLLSVTTFLSRGEKQCCNIIINGERVVWRSIGHRFDLKQLRQTREVFKDKGECFLDLVDMATPKGARWLATFRLHCP